MRGKPTHKKRRKTASKQTRKHSEYSDNEFVDKDAESESDASSTSSAYSSIPSLSGWKKRSRKREQPARASKGKLRQATEDGRGGPAIQPAGGPDSTKENEDNHNALQSATAPDPKPAQLRSVIADDLVGDTIQVSAEDDNLEEEALEDTMNEADREAEAANRIKERYGHISIWSTS